MKNMARHLLIRYPRLRDAAKLLMSFVDPRFSVSSQYSLVAGNKVSVEAERLAKSWTAESIPARQRQLVNKQLRDFASGKSVQAFDVFVDLLRPHASAGQSRSLLEIGCSSGYYSDVLRLRGLPFAYSGCDYSSPFIEMARNLYPKLDFRVEDATQLTYPNASFDTVVSGCCLLHIPDYETAIAETARVARNLVLFHRTPLVIGRPTEVFTKAAYGIETIEIHLSDTLFYRLAADHGLEIIQTATLSTEQTPRGPSEVVSILCRKSESSHV
ncbi:class I SAM-dependent methyltransferase [Rhizobium leguminosarum]|uniref:class I SAM-dependent methyltransferase n=1 Tax=Rhizobium leguminosarum TaxID=384 RepID=UPI001C928CB3|nr:class I SAM-dependent methyltransferase [Rhizobium leguminosarum]MBY2921228.1 class I SAM-dependent methyltransferase [Rhizobium leguminosarum]